MFLGDYTDVDDIVLAIEKLQRHASALLASRGAAASR